MFLLRLGKTRHGIAKEGQARLVKVRQCQAMPSIAKQGPAIPGKVRLRLG
jgi:hypothetical protein